MDVFVNKLAKAWKTRKSPGTLGLKKSGAGQALGQKSLGPKYCYRFLAELDNFKKRLFELCQMMYCGRGTARISKYNLCPAVPNVPIKHHCNGLCYLHPTTHHSTHTHDLYEKDFQF